jgi:hypothetical protein
MRFQDTKFLNHYEQFSKVVNDCSMRSTIDGYVYYRFVQQYDFQNILEIGFYEGLTCGLFAESSAATAHIDSVDPILNTTIFNQVYLDYRDKITLFKGRSQDFAFEREYDLINIDGDKSYQAISVDLTNAVKTLTRDGVIIVNEYYLDGVDQAVSEIMPDSGLVPFLRTNQSTFFSRPHVDRATFLDQQLPSIVNNFVRFQNIELNDRVVLYVDSVPIFTDRIDFFKEAVKLYNL